MLFDYRFQLAAELACKDCGCDLMLFDYRFQYTRDAGDERRGCDLMLFDYRFQLIAKDIFVSSVVI